MHMRLSRKRRWLVPEVVQTSAMDCGPAVLKCLLAGFGIPVHYGRLREACQTDLDGTSIDTLEEVANRLGLSAEQVMLPPDQVLLPQARALPAILVVRLPNGSTHFVLVWRRHGPLVQVMDPSLGRRWMTCRQLVGEMHLHRQRVPADAWSEWARSNEMKSLLDARLHRLGLGGQATPLINATSDKRSWQPMAQLDAAIRTVESLVQAGGLSRGATARRTLSSLLDQANEAAAHGTLIPDRFWSVRPCPDSAANEEHLMLSGAVLIRVAGRFLGRELPNTESDPTSQAQPADVRSPDIQRVETQPAEVATEILTPLGAELTAALAEPESRPLSTVWRFLRGAGWVSLLSLIVCLGLASICTVLEALLLRGILDLGRDLALVPQRLEAIACFVALGAGVLLLEYRIGSGLYRLGRRLETSLRVAFLSKIPRLHDRYFQSRPTSDMAERGHALQRVRLVPQCAGQFLRAAATLLITAAAIAWVEPACMWLAFLAAGVAILLPVLFLPVLQGLDLRVRTHVGALTRFSFDALLGLAAVRAHGGQPALTIEHEGLLVEWSQASYRLLRWRLIVDGLQSLTGIAMAAGLLMIHASHATDATGILLLAYWALNIPALGNEMALLVHQYPSYRNVTLRLLEPLGAPEQDLLVAADEARERPTDVTPDDASQPPRDKATDVSATLAGAAPSGYRAKATKATSVHLENVHVRAAGHTILESLDLELPPQSHVAIVGPSGAGKSSLVGLLLGWHHATSGQVRVDGLPLDAARLAALRAATVWVDPAVQLWNRSLLENLLYGNLATGLDQVGDVLQQADLYDVLQRLPAGLQTRLGESGGLLSGGEGQRVKLGRGFARRDPQLVILDEPFRGLERPRRRALLERARLRWKAATLICITHDVSETLEFPRVLVLDAGRLVEDASPRQLVGRPDSLYRSLLAAEDAVRTGLWGSSIWRRMQLGAGRLEPTAVGEGDAP